MNENGYYDGWTEHTVTVVPTFDGVDIRIGGRNRNDIKEYMHQTFDQALRTDVEYERMAPARERLGIVMASRWIDQSRLVWDVNAPGCDVRTFAGDDPSETYQGSPLERARAYAVSLAWELARKR